MDIYAKYAYMFPLRNLFGNSGKTLYPVPVKPEPDYLLENPEPEPQFDFKIRYPVPVLKIPIRSVWWILLSVKLAVNDQ